MTWNGKQWSRPLIFLEKDSVELLCRQKGFRLVEDMEPLLPSPQVGGELFLLILLQNGKMPEAVEVMSHLIAPRVGVWWALRCYRSVTEDVRKDFEKDGLTPQARRQKRTDDMVKELSDTSEIEDMIEEHHQVMEKYRKEAEEEIMAQKPLSPAEVVLGKIQAFGDAMKALYPDIDAPPEVPPSPEVRDMAERIRQEVARQVDARMAPFVKKEAEPMPPEFDRVSGERIFAKIREKGEAVKPAIDAEMAKYFPLKLKGLPPKASQAKKDAAVAAALRWLLVPSDDNGKLACEAAVAAQSGPESMLAFAAFWSSTNLKTETGLVPTNPALPPMGISKTLLQLALMEGGEMDYDARYEEFLRIGIECADGTSTWDEYGNEVRAEEGAPPATRDDDVFGRRSGFGRD